MSSSDAEAQALPEGWTSCTDRKGRTYYYHRATKRSSWTVPTATSTDGPGRGEGEETRYMSGSSPGLRRVASDRSRARSSSGASVASSGSGGGGPDASASWRECQDKSGRTYYYNRVTKETAWQLPEGATLRRSSTDPRKRGVIAAAASEARDTRSRSSSSGARLGAGWRRYADPGSGREYFYHKPSGRTSWSRPRELVDLGMATGEVAAGGGAGAASGGGAGAASGGGAGAASGGEAGAGSGGGVRSRGASTDSVGSWGSRDRTASGASTASGGSRPRSSSVPLPKPWVRLVDDDTQRRYYYNEETDESFWKAPPELKRAVREQRRARRLLRAATEGVASGSDTGTEGSGSEAGDDVGSGEAALALPSGWRALEDAKGRTYYYEVASKRVSWTFPKVAALPKDWTQLRDSTTRRTYYFNAALNRSSWTRPRGDEDPTPYVGPSLHLVPGGAFEEGGDDTKDDADEAVTVPDDDPSHSAEKTHKGAPTKDESLGEPAAEAVDGVADKAAVPARTEAETTVVAAGGAPAAGDGGDGDHKADSSGEQDASLSAGSGSTAPASSHGTEAGSGGGTGKVTAEEAAAAGSLDVRTRQARPTNVFRLRAGEHMFPADSALPPVKFDRVSQARVFPSVLRGQQPVFFVNCSGVDSRGYAALGTKDAAAQFEGYLKKRGRGTSRFGFKNWKRRYFVLEDRVLSYYKDASVTKLKGQVPVYGASVVKQKAQPMYFTVVPRGEPALATLMQAETPQEASAWIEALAAAGALVQKQGGRASDRDRRHSHSSHGSDRARASAPP